MDIVKGLKEAVNGPYFTFGTGEPGERVQWMHGNEYQPHTYGRVQTTEKWKAAGGHEPSSRFSFPKSENFQVVAHPIYFFSWPRIHHRIIKKTSGRREGS
jgi:hypothetical protein